MDRWDRWVDELRMDGWRMGGRWMVDGQMMDLNTENGLQENDQ
jgi:hypothetical protein